MIDELIGALKNALERGSSIEQAARSLINAGYNPQEVREAANAFNSSASHIVSPVQVVKSKSQMQSMPVMRVPDKPQVANKPQIQVQTFSQPQIQQTPQSQQPKGQIVIQQPQTKTTTRSDEEELERKQTVAILLIILILLLGIVIMVLMFKDEIIKALTG